MKEKVIGVGLSKTGTSTLGKCLAILGYNHCSFEKDLVIEMYDGEYSNIWKTAKRYDSFDDFPWALLYKEFDKKYPNSRFILTIRKDEKKWLKSFIKHSQRSGPTKVRKFVYGNSMPQEAPLEYINFYLEHNKKVKTFFERKKEKLLVVCWEKGDGWKKICSFLNKKIPKVNFPHENKSKRIDVMLHLNPIIRKIPRGKIFDFIFRNKITKKIYNFIFRRHKK